MDSQQARTVWQRYWPVDLLAVVVLVLVLIFGAVLNERTSNAKQLARTLDRQAQRQRQAICAILQNIPGHIPAEIRHARAAFARPGHPDDCRPRPHLSPTPTPRHAAPTVVVIRPASPTPRPASPAPSRTASPRPTPSHSPHPSSSPTPCTVHDVLTDPTHCLHL